MDVGIVGAGAIAMGYAAHLIVRGHSPAIWSPSGTRTQALRAGKELIVTGAIEGRFSPRVATSAEMLAQYDVIVLALPAYGHRAVIDALVPHLGTRHTVIFSGHLSFAALYLSKALAARSIAIPIAAWNTTALTAKAPGSPTDLRVGAIRKVIDLAVVPVAGADRAQTTCEEIFGDVFAIKDDILTVALSNLNPQNHLGMVLCNLTRIEQGEVWHQNSKVTPAVGSLIEGLDRERIEIAAAYGKSVRTIFDNFSASLGVAAKTVVENYRMSVGRGIDPIGPKDMGTRYILEDVPYGLVPTVILAEMAGIAAPLHRSGIDIMSACCGRDFMSVNDLLPALSITDGDELKRMAIAGFKIG